MKRAAFFLFLVMASFARAELSKSYAPIVGFDPSDGLILGAAAFVKSPVDYLDVEGMGTFANVYSGVLNYRRSLSSRLSAEIDNNFSSFYDLYYGEGMGTQVDDQVRLDQLVYKGEFRMPLALAQGLSLGPLIYDRVRRETGVNEDQARRLIPGEDTFEFGLELKFDGRDNEFSPSKGIYAEAKALNHPTPLGDGGNFSQAGFDLRAYQSFGPVTFAGRLLGATSWGNPSYMYRYQLGGSEVLRGFYGNRFRGKMLAAAQLEARFPIWAWLSGDLFTDEGEVSDSSLGDDAQVTAGLGLRIALPPSGMMKARIDYAFAKDQQGLYVAFGHAF
jgi:outer membrane protein assembly factor BamA